MNIQTVLIRLASEFAVVITLLSISTTAFALPKSVNVRSAAVTEIIAGMKRDKTAQAPTKRINLFIYSNADQLPMEVVGYYTKRLQEAFSGPVASYGITDFRELDQILRRSPNESIQSLTFNNFHGMEDIIVIPNPVPTRNHVTRVSTLFDKIGKMNLKWEPDAFVSINACNVIAKDKKSALKQMRDYAGWLSLKSGMIFLNYSMGSDTLERRLLTPFYEQKSPILGLIAQLGTAVSLPMYYSIDHFFFNRGFLYLKSETREALIKTQYTKSRKGIIDGTVVHQK